MVWSRGSHCRALARSEPRIFLNAFWLRGSLTPTCAQIIWSLDGWYFRQVCRCTPMTAWTRPLRTLYPCQASSRKWSRNRCGSGDPGRQRECFRYVCPLSEEYSSPLRKLLSCWWNSDALSWIPSLTHFRIFWGSTHEGWSHRLYRAGL